MRSTFCVASTVVAVLGFTLGVDAQVVGKRAASLAQLELTVDVAATTEEGYPAALRVTVKNVGNLAVTMPRLEGGCHPDNGVGFKSWWTAREGGAASVMGGGCVGDSGLTLNERVQETWILLRPSEYMTTTLRFVPAGKEPGTIEYWVEYEPPDATDRDVEDLLQAGYVIPTEKLATEHRSFEIH